jgi:ATP synthase assembly factor FMC1, mitochondrial
MVDIVPSQARSLYRAMLRELPRRPLSSPSPLQVRIRTAFSRPSITAGQDGDVTIVSRIQQAEQFVQYVQAQRMHAVLLERYNPGINNPDQEERIRLTARRVGMELPIESNKREE